MKNLVIEIEREDLELYKTIQTARTFNLPDYRAELIKGKTRIYLGKSEYNFVEDLVDRKEAKFLIEFFESGGGKTHTGEAVIVCDVEGRPLRPVEVFTKGHLANSDHARFLERRAVEITVNHFHQVRITKYQYMEGDKDKSVYISDDVLWEGKMGNLPKTYLGRFETAVNVAYQKCRCYHCREPHYIL